MPLVNIQRQEIAQGPCRQEFQQKALKFLHNRVNHATDKIQEIQYQTIALAQIAFEIYDAMRDEYNYVFDDDFEYEIAPLLKYKCFGRKVSAKKLILAPNVYDYTYETWNDDGEPILAFDSDAYYADKSAYDEHKNDLIYVPYEINNVRGAFNCFYYIIDVIHDMLDTLDNFIYYYYFDTNEEPN